MRAGLGEFFPQLDEGHVLGGGAGDEHQVATGGHEVLVLAKGFAEAALGAVAAYGVAHGRGGRDHADPGRAGWDHEVGGGVAALPPDGEGAAIEAAAEFTNDADVALAAQVLLRAETHGGVARRARVGGLHSRTRVATNEGERGSDDRQALAAFEATGADDFASAWRGHTGAITNLAGAFLAVRTECRLHDFCRKRGSEVSEGLGTVKGGVWPKIGRVNS